jgi:hypothetical protein
MRDHTPSPFTRNVISFSPPRSDASAPSTSSFQPGRSAYREYISNRSLANRFASSPPSAPRISKMTFLSSFGSFGRSSTRSSACSAAIVASASSIWARRNSRSSAVESPNISLAAARSSWAAR